MITIELVVQALVGGSVGMIMWIYGRKMTQSMEGLRKDFHIFLVENEHRMTSVEKDVEELKRER